MYFNFKDVAIVILIEFKIVMVSIIYFLTKGM